MIYMVEMALLEPDRRAEWDAWYLAHQHRLLSIPGFHASQRFEALHLAASPFVALHQVDSPELFSRPGYRTGGGPTNTGEWQMKMGNWHRNLFAGLDATPDVPLDARLVIVEDVADAPALERLAVTWLETVGLDRSVPRRGLAVEPPAVADPLIGLPHVRVLRPLGPRLVGQT
jgi:hypothetical protein